MPESHDLVAILPMKANSERVKGKNFKMLNGKPLYKWVLDTLLSLKEIDLIIINTDAFELIKEFPYKSSKILIRERRKELCGDFVSMNKIIKDDISNIDSKIYLMTHTTNPFLSTFTMSEAIKVFNNFNKKEKYDSLFSVNKVQTRFYSGNGTPINHDPNELIRTQDWMGIKLGLLQIKDK